MDFKPTKWKINISSLISIIFNLTLWGGPFLVLCGPNPCPQTFNKYVNNLIGNFGLFLLTTIIVFVLIYVVWSFIVE
ncbi:MAG: hypothetical protein KKF48_03435 [Nanoarchaeota archaeon]|nr:hypothetical protein [Nanoarchaeota archaeon]MBU1028072.1 hypothetical protein [Nanoarchaeota archaeon]